MVNGKHTLTTKVLAMLLSVVMLISLIPAGAVSVSAATPDKMGTLSCITANGTVTDAEGAEAKATYGNLSLNWHKKDPSVYRYNDGWWVGIKMTAPADMLTAEDFTGVTYQRCVSLADDTWTAATPFWNVQDSNINVESTERFLTLWGMVNEQFINEALLRGTTINYIWRFDWNADGTYEQVATLEINPEDMVLTKDGAQVYPATDNSGTVAPISEGLALQTDATANIVRVSYTADTVLNWVKADPSVTRFNDGWWAGIKMTAPADMLTAADFENVTYQNKSGNVWSEAKSFWDAQDSDKNAESTQRFIGLWGLLNEDFLTRANGGKFEYHWRFDWDGDGYYEQIVILEIDSTKITLLDETGVQVYPELGKVTTLTGGTVVGSGTGKTVVTAENLSLQWSPKNEAIGRMEDGWWAGIQITAPASAVITKDSDVNYKSKIGDADWSAVKSFYNNQDSAKDGTVHYMQLWTRLDATRVTAAIEAGKDITTQWQFDWDKDGKYEQTVTFNIDPETVILNKVQVSDFGFTETATDKTVWYGTGFIDVKAWSDTSDGVVTYALDVDESVATLEVKDNTATVVFNKDLDVGDDGVFVTVTATLAETDVYAGATKTFTFKIVKQEVTGFSISNPAPIKRYYEGGELLPKQFDNIATDNIGGGIIKYKVTSGNDVAEFAVIDADGYSDSSALKIKKAGEVTVTAYRLADQKYKQAFAEYTLTIDPADQNAGFASDQSAIDYSFLDRYDPAEEFAVTGQKTKEKITYAIVETGDDAVAEMENGKIKTKKIGTFTLTATVPGDDNHNEQILTKTVTINRGKRTTAKLEQQGPITVVYNDNNNEFVNKLFTDDTELGRDEADTVTYKLFAQEAISDGDIAPTDEAPVVTVDPTSPELKINRSGKVTIKATIAENDKYEAFSVEYVLTIKKATQNITLPAGEISHYYGIEEYACMTGNAPSPVKVENAADGKGYGDGAYSFAIAETSAKAAADIGASVVGDKIVFTDAQDGVRNATMTIEVTKAADLCYDACYASYTMKVYPLSGIVHSDLRYFDSQKVEDQWVKAPKNNAWYSGDIVIAPPAAQNGRSYTIAFSDTVTTTTYTETVSYGAESTMEDFKQPTVYLRRDDGAITAAIPVENYLMDKTAPQVTEVTYGTNIWATIGEKLFGFKNDKIAISVTAEDNGSRLDYIEYSIDGGASYTTVELDRNKEKHDFGQEKITQTFYVPAEEMPAQFRDEFVCKVTDVAGNTSKEWADGTTLVVDTLAPNIIAEYQYKTNEHKNAGGIYYTKGDVIVNFEIDDDANSDLTFATAENEANAPRPVVTIQKNSGEIITQNVEWTINRDTNKLGGSIELSGQGDYVVTLSFEDRSGNPATFTDAKENTTEGFEQEIRIDGTVPTIASYEFSGTSVDKCEVAHNNTTAVRFYYNKDQKLTLKVTEHNFDPSQVDLTVVAKNLAGNDIDISSKKYADFAKTAGNWKSEGDEHTLVFADAELFDIDANYTLSLTVTDYAGNSTTDEDELFTVDTLANDQPEQPTIKFEAASLGEIILDKLTFGFFKAPLTVTVTSSDAISGLKYINYYYKGAKGEYDATEVKIDPVDKKVDDDGITISFEIPEKTEFKGIVSATAKDWAANESAKQEVGYDTKNTELKGIFLDNIAPQIGVTYTPAEKSAEEEPTVVTYYKNDVKTNNFVDATQAYYNGAVNATITITENNFFEGMEQPDGSTIHQVGILVTKTDHKGKEIKTEYLPAEKAAKMFIEEPAENVTWTTASITWTHKDNVHSFTIPYEDDADYEIEIIYTDFALNDSKITADDLAENDVKTRSYVSKPVTVDTTAPVFSEYTFTPGEIKGTQGERNYYNVAQKVSVTVTEHNFDPSQVELTVIAKNVDNKKNIDISSKEYADFANTAGNWKSVGDEHTLEFTDKELFDIEANYTLSLTVTDRATNSIKDDDELFTVDGTKPEIKIDYDQPSLAQIVLENLTFGVFNATVEVTITASDAIAGVEYVDYTYEGTEGHYDGDAVGETEKNQKLKDGKISFTIDKNFKGTVTATAYDWADNSKRVDFGNDKPEDGKTEGNKLDGIILDNIAPEISVKYEAVKDNTIVSYYKDVVKDGKTVKVSKDNFAEADQAFFNGDVNAIIAITENNFFEGLEQPDGSTIHQVGILVTKTDHKGDVIKTEYLPAEKAAKMFIEEPAENVTWTTASFTWTHKGNVHSFTIPYEDDADYKIEIIYTDFALKDSKITADGLAENDVKTRSYGSKPVTVDKTPPVVSVEYDNKDVAAKYATDNGIREYFTADQKATVTVKEHNFRAEDFKATVTALYSNGEDLNAQELDSQFNGTFDDYFDSYLSDINNWTKNGDEYTIELDFSVEANYTFDYTYEDLAQNAAAEYAVDEFTVDKTDPERLTVIYDGDVKMNLFDRILNVITFGYYDAKVKVIISADDAISGIDHFVYSYTKHKGVSNVNASLKNVVIGSEDIVQDGATFTAEFEIPKAVLQNNNQFNGIVDFTAVERSTRDTDHKETQTIVVDNIAPKATVTFNDPVQTVQGNPIVSYYNGNIDATIVINEANFHSEEVAVLVNGEPVKVKWVDNSVDIHTGTFTLSEEGDYIVTVDYTDRSGNVMEHYESHQLTIDVTNPVINVSGVKHNSANNGETITFTVSVTDKNIPLDGFKPVLQVYTQKPGEGKNTFVYKLESVALGTPTTSTNAAGETVYSYTISNLKLDGYYTLTCTAKDYADHAVSEISAQSNQGGTVNTTKINYTVNREGSVFWIETEHNDKYSSEPETMLKNKLNGAYANDKVVVRLFERNVDTVDGDAENKTVLTLNDGSSSEDIPLVEKENYTKNTNVATDAGQIWYENVYTLNNEIFNHDGVYSVNAITYDRATNSNVNTQHEAAVISFTLDRTSPAISSNIKNNQRINDTEFWVEFGITETNLDPETIVVKITDNNGETVEKKLSDLDDLGNNEYKFLVESGYNYTVEIVAKDAAGNTSELYKVEHLTISTNIFILWYANTPLFWGSIGGTILLAGLIVLLIFLKKKKKKEND